jgi:precorrin-6A/cobalt-precorrin-6A reductase
MSHRPRTERKVHLLILGGTGEGAALAAAALARFPGRLAVTTSLAGRTARPAALPGAARSGGFSGSAALTEYLRAAQVAAVIDATHPFAARISQLAREACAAAGVPRLFFERPPWPRHPDDRWIDVADADAAAAALPGLGRRAFLTIGGRGLEAFAELSQIHFLVRLIEPPRAPLPLAAAELLLGRGPFTLSEERHILEQHGIDMLVTKASGGAATRAKLVAARERCLPVVMLRRPPPPPGPRAATADAALDWLARTLPLTAEETVP